MDSVTLLRDRRWGQRAGDWRASTVTNPDLLEMNILWNLLVLFCTWGKIKLHSLWRIQKMLLLYSGHLQLQFFSGIVSSIQVSPWAEGVCCRGEEYLLQISIFYLLNGSSEKCSFLMGTQPPLYLLLLALDFVMPVWRTTFGGHYKTPSACFQSNPTFLVKDCELQCLSSFPNCSALSLPSLLGQHPPVLLFQESEAPVSTVINDTLCFFPSFDRN